jgi:predicted metal-dependent peptidase
MTRELNPEEKLRILRQVIKARSHLVLWEPFWGHLALGLEIVQDPPVSWWQGFEPTMGTDGTVLGFDSRYVKELNFDELIGLNCHEVFHEADGHSWRRGNRDPAKWNRACDYAINPQIKESGKVLPKDGLLNMEWLGKSPEWIYDQLPDEQQPPGGKGDQDDQQQQQQQGGGDQDDEQGDQEQPQQGNKPIPNNGGLVLDDRTGDQSKRAEWQNRVLVAAAIARQAGKLPGGVEQLIDSIVNPKVSWIEALWKFFARRARVDYSFRRPNWRYAPQGLYLPIAQSNVLGPGAILWDTSGSRDYPEAYAECAAEVKAIMESCRPEKVTVFYVDDGIQRIETFERDEDIEFNPIGGGGTDFTSCFSYIEENDIEIEWMVGITDLDTMGFATHEPNFPVIWAATEHRTAPFGEIIYINE